ncbi:DUF1764-domain-containing protein [Phlegmacium glaucopus]|nr:DUF1764-domain-containing protein [Phlegmacium glaucopus]
MSEIDDIFASKAKSKQKQKPSTSSLLQPKPKSVEEASSKKRPLPETVVDKSADLAGPSKRRKKDSISNKSSKPKKSKKNHDKTADFEDSRGSGDRRKTEEGWTVYKEHELGLSGEGGDTPLCPFDCNCCF